MRQFAIKSFPLLVICAMTTVAWSFSSGPPDGITGAPPSEPTCAQIGCHATFALNVGSGTLSISAPSNYSGGDTIDVSLNLQDAGQQRWGFELTVLDSSNQPVGNIIVTDPVRTQLTGGGGGREYLKHTSTGTDGGTPDTAPGWSFRWAAPSTGQGPITFYMAGNAANNNGTTSSDYIYSTSATVSESPTSIIDDAIKPEVSMLAQNYPNPFNPATTIHFSIDSDNAGLVSLFITNVLGQRVRTVFHSRPLTPGVYAESWNGQNSIGSNVASGTYYYSLVTNQSIVTRSMTLLR